MLIEYVMQENGICESQCPYIPSIRIGSMACELCRYYFGVENKKIRCAGERLANEKEVHSAYM